MTYTLDERQCADLEISTKREWLLTNGMGGYAMGTVSGINTRRYHGHLVAATKPPATRHVLLAAIDAFVQIGEHAHGISANQYPGSIFPDGHHYLQRFSVSAQACWQFLVENFSVEKTLAMHEGLNAVTVSYENTGAEPFLLILRPLVAHKFYHGNFAEQPGYPKSLSFPKHKTVVDHEGISLTIAHHGAQRTPVQGWYYRFEHAREFERGLDGRCDLFCPCELRYELAAGEAAVLVASSDAEPKPISKARVEEQRKPSLKRSLQAAAKHFIIATPQRATIMAGYPWFTDWGRDTMISLPGICLHTGRVAHARKLLLDYAQQVFHGLIPNRFADDAAMPEYNTADATLWYANAIYKTLQAEWDDQFAREMRRVLSEIVVWHQEGTLFGIKVDPNDGLLTQGSRGVQLTWMDVKIGDWVVTPRHGKPVEVNGLWINALRVLEWLCERLGEDCGPYRNAAEKAETAFALKFWHDGRGHYLDTVDPIDVTLRPNQLVAMSLPFGPAGGDKAKRALALISRELLTPYGLRTLSPSEMGYRGRYEGTLEQLDKAYHQGTVWPWLLGPYVTALVKLNGDKKEARRILSKAMDMLAEYGIGGIAEVYDGDEPQRPNGCPFQAWSVAEILRAWIEDCGGD